MRQRISFNQSIEFKSFESKFKDEVEFSNIHKNISIENCDFGKTVLLNTVKIAKLNIVASHLRNSFVSNRSELKNIAILSSVFVGEVKFFSSHIEKISFAKVDGKRFTD